MRERKAGFLTIVLALAMFLFGLFLAGGDHLASAIVPLMERSGAAGRIAAAVGGFLDKALTTLRPWMSITGTLEFGSMIPMGIIFMLMTLLFVVYRKRKPYSLLFWAYLWFMVFSFGIFFRMREGVTTPESIMNLLSPDKKPLVIILLVLECFLAFIFMYVTGSLDQKWREKREREMVRMDMHDAAAARLNATDVPSPMDEEERPLSARRQRKLEKKRLRAEAKAENRRARAEEKEAIKKEEEDWQRKEDEEKAEEEAESEFRKAEAKADRKNEKKQRKLEKKMAKKKAREASDEDDSDEPGDDYALPSGEYVRDLPARARSMDEPISFPEVADIPRLETIEHSEDIDLVAPDPQKEFRASFGLMNSLKEEVKREEEPLRTIHREEESRPVPPKKEPEDEKIRDRYTSGSMLEATLESLNTVDTDSVDRKSLHLSPIIGLDDDRDARAEAARRRDADSFAPSTLSKDHPRYRMFESLQRPPERDNSQIGTPEYREPERPGENENFAPSGLSKDHPRYKLFESLRNSGPRKSNISHMPGMPFEAEGENHVPNAEYSSTYVTEEAQQESLSSRLSREKLDSAVAGSTGYMNPPQMTRPGINDASRNQAPQQPDYQASQTPNYQQPQQNRQDPRQYRMPQEGGYQAPGYRQPAQSYQQPVQNTYQQQPSYQAPVQPTYQQPVQPQYQAHEETFQRPVEEKRTYNPSMIDPMGDWQSPKIERRPEPVEPPVAPAPQSAVEERHAEVPQVGEQVNEMFYSIGISGLASQDEGMIGVQRREMMSYTAPGKDILVDYPTADREIDYLTRERGDAIISCFEKFKIHVTLDNIIKGPTVTMYEIKLGEGIPVSKVKNHNEDIMYALGIRSVRILAPVPGKQAIGIEVPNTKRATIGFKDMLYAFEADESNRKMKVPMILGRTVTGDPVSIDVAKTPHLLIAGSTGSGKSVGINSLIATILYNKSPREVRLIMVDPKVVELKIYNGIPHLLTPVITEAKKVKAVLSWLTEEMDRRYEMLSRYNVRNIEAFNEKLKKQRIFAEKLPYIVLIMDEYADLMTTIGKDIEYYVGRLTAMARAVGIHLVLATQRPDADVVTGIIKANIPSRIAFAVGSGVNSRIILDELGAESLLGKGDMLYRTPSNIETKRIQGAFLSDEEVEEIVAAVKKNGEPDYLDESIFEDPEEDEGADGGDDWDGAGTDPDEDEYEQAKSIVYERKCASASYLQRRMKIGYNKAARFVERMEEEGIIGPPNGSKPRELIKMI